MRKLCFNHSASDYHVKSWRVSGDSSSLDRPSANKTKKEVLNGQWRNKPLGPKKSRRETETGWHFRWSFKFWKPAIYRRKTFAKTNKNGQTLRIELGPDRMGFRQCFAAFGLSPDWISDWYIRSVKPPIHANNRLSRPIECILPLLLISFHRHPRHSSYKPTRSCQSAILNIHRKTKRSKRKLIKIDNTNTAWAHVQLTSGRHVALTQLDRDVIAIFGNYLRNGMWWLGYTIPLQLLLARSCGWPCFGLAANQ